MNDTLKHLLQILSQVRWEHTQGTVADAVRDWQDAGFPGLELSSPVRVTPIASTAPGGVIYTLEDTVQLIGFWHEGSPKILVCPECGYEGSVQVELQAIGTLHDDNSVTAWDHTFAFDDLQDDAGCACRNCPTNGTLREFLRGS
jgi:hypothetical protein